MNTSQFTDTVHRVANDLAPDQAYRWGIVLIAQAAILLTYMLATSDPVTAPRYLLYPFVWINVSAIAVVSVTPTPGSRTHQLVAGTIAGLYFLAMLVVAGFLGPGNAAMTGVHVIQAPPGWGPMLAFQSAAIRLFIVPFQVIGYATLAYLVYAALLDASRGVLSGTLGLVSCVGCTWTVVAPLLAGTVGSLSGISHTIYTLSYDLTTVVFLATVALLVYSHRSTNV